MKVKNPQIVVVGGGAGGLELTARLGRKFGRKEFDIILIERNRTHIWKPLLHEVAAGSLDEVGYRAHCKKWGYRFFYGSLEDIDRENWQVVVAPLIDVDGAVLMESHRIRYDYLVIAVGSITNDFGTAGVRNNGLFLNTRDDATGVELAAELYNAAAALRHYGLEIFDESRLKVSLLEASRRILPALPEELVEAVHEELEALGVEVVINALVTKATNTKLRIKGGKVYPADLRVWAGGVKGSELLQQLGGLESTRNNQLIVRPTLQTTHDDRIFAIGDCAFYQADARDRPVPPRVQAAHQMVRAAFKNIVALVNKGPLSPFIYRDHGSLGSLSRFSSVGLLMGNFVGGSMAIKGRLARLAYLSLYRIHLLTVHGWTSTLGRNPL